MSVDDGECFPMSNHALVAIANEIITAVLTNRIDSSSACNGDRLYMSSSLVRKAYGVVQKMLEATGSPAAAAIPNQNPFSKDSAVCFQITDPLDWDLR